MLIRPHFYFTYYKQLLRWLNEPGRIPVLSYKIYNKDMECSIATIHFPFFLPRAFSVGLSDHCNFSRIRFWRRTIRFFVINGNLSPHKLTRSFISQPAFRRFAKRREWNWNIGAVRVIWIHWYLVDFLGLIYESFRCDISLLAIIATYPQHETTTTEKNYCNDGNY